MFAAGTADGRKEDPMNFYTKAVKAVLAAQLASDKGETSRQAYAALDAAQAIDDAREALVEKATFVAEKATRFATEMRKGLRSGSNPVAYSSTIFEMAAQQATFEARERGLREMLFAFYGAETAKAFYASIESMVRSSRRVDELRAGDVVVVAAGMSFSIERVTKNATKNQYTIDYKNGSSEVLAGEKVVEIIPEGRDA